MYESGYAVVVFFATQEVYFMWRRMLYIEQWSGVSRFAVMEALEGEHALIRLFDESGGVARLLGIEHHSGASGTIFLWVLPHR